MPWAAGLPAIFMLNGRPRGAVPDRGCPAAGRTEATPGTRTAGRAAMTGPARPHRGAGAPRAVSIARHMRPGPGRDPGRIPARAGLGRAGAARTRPPPARRSGRLAWRQRHATRRAAAPGPGASRIPAAASRVPPAPVPGIGRALLGRTAVGTARKRNLGPAPARARPGSVPGTAHPVPDPAPGTGTGWRMGAGAVSSPGGRLAGAGRWVQAGVVSSPGSRPAGGSRGAGVVSSPGSLPAGGSRVRDGRSPAGTMTSGRTRRPRSAPPTARAAPATAPAAPPTKPRPRARRPGWRRGRPWARCPPRRLKSSWPARQSGTPRHRNGPVAGYRRSGGQRTGGHTSPGAAGPAGCCCWP